MPRHSRLPRYITRDKGPDGKERFYYRRPGQKKVRIHGVPYTPGFMAAYAQAMGGANVVAITPGPIPPLKKVNDFDWLCERHCESAEWLALDDKLSKPMRRRIYTRISRMPIKDASKVLFGSVPLTAWNRDAVRAIRDRVAKDSGPSMANEFRKALRVLFGWALDAGHVQVNPATEFKSLKSKNVDGHHTWTLEEVEQFENRWPVGTPERLALGLLLYTGQRASDVRQFGPQHVKMRDGAKWLVFTQHKNRNSKPVHLEIPLRPELEALIEGIETESFLVNSLGKPHERSGFTDFFGEACIAADVPGRSHGLRKAAAVRLAMLGATTKEIMSITGHTTMKEVERYTKQADQIKLAASATRRGSK
jgi:integrase